MTGEELLKDSFGLVGVTNVTPNKNAQALRFLNNMIANLSIDTSKMFETVEETFSLVIGTSSYTIGTGGDFSTDRPDRIHNAFLSDGDTDYPMTEITEKSYDNIVVKTNNGRPDFYFFKREYPLAKLIFDLEPDKTYTLNLKSYKVLTTFSMGTLTATIVIPAEYLEFFVYNLAIRLAPIYGMKISPEVAVIATSSKNNIENINSTPVPPIAPESGLTAPRIKNADWQGE
jgi:hypothetical protein